MTYFEFSSLLNIYVHIYFYRVTKPGGYIEISDRRNHVSEGPIFRKLLEARKHIHCFNSIILFS
jgi:hypothetical protein